MKGVGAVLRMGSAAGCAPRGREALRRTLFVSTSAEPCVRSRKQAFPMMGADRPSLRYTSLPVEACFHSPFWCSGTQGVGKCEGEGGQGAGGPAVADSGLCNSIVQPVPARERRPRHRRTSFSWNLG